MSDSPPPWYYQSKMAQYKAEIAYHTGREDGDIRAIGLAVKALADGEGPVCVRCLKWLPRHREWCPIATAYRLLHESLPPGDTFELQTSVPIKNSGVTRLQPVSSPIEVMEATDLEKEVTPQVETLPTPTPARALPLPAAYPSKAR